MFVLKILQNLFHSPSISFKSISYLRKAPRGLGTPLKGEIDVSFLFFSSFSGERRGIGNLFYCKGDR